jgi:hypothetical protein
MSIVCWAAVRFFSVFCEKGSGISPSWMRTLEESERTNVVKLIGGGAATEPCAAGYAGPDPSSASSRSSAMDHPGRSTAWPKLAALAESTVRSDDATGAIFRGRLSAGMMFD